MIKQNGYQHSDWRLLNIPFFHRQNPVQFVLYALIKILRVILRSCLICLIENASAYAAHVVDDRVVPVSIMDFKLLYGSKVNPNAVLLEQERDFHPVVFDCIDVESIRKMALPMNADLSRLGLEHA